MTQETLRMVRRKHSAWIITLILRMLIHTIDIFKLVTQPHMQSGMLGADLNPALLMNARVITRQYGIMSIVRKKTGGKNLQLQKGDGSFTKDDASTAEVLNQKYYDTFTKENIEELPSINSKPQLNSRLSFFKVTREQVLQVLKDLRIDKSPGVGGIHPHILKELSDSISYPLSLIFQDCIKSGIIPQQWKDAIIAPIF